MNFPAFLGLLRSLLIYHAIPGRITRLTRFYSQWIRPGDLCFDIGAHAGNHIRAFRRLKAKVIALEPQPPFTHLLKGWFRSDPGVVLLEQAVGNEPGELPLFISPRTPTVSSLSPTWTHLSQHDPSFAKVTWDTQITVPVTTLDTLISTFGLPVFCKIDVEGYEPEVLHGLTQPLPLLAFEYLPATRNLTLACIDYLTQLAPYQYNWVVGEQMKLTPNWVSPEKAVHYIHSLSPTDREGNLYARVHSH